MIDQLRLRSTVPAAVLLLAACSGDNAGPAGRVGPPYLAIVARLDVPIGVSAGDQYVFRIAELSGTVGIDTTVLSSPTDTVILSVEPATYRVTLDGLPANCSARDGTVALQEVPAGANTALVRFQVLCRAPLVVETGTDGTGADDQYYVRIVSAGVPERLRIIGANDTMRIDSLPPGEYDVELGAIAPNCDVTSDGRDRVRVVLPGAGGARASFRVRCSDPARRPRVLDYSAGTQDGGYALQFRAVDPDRDLERYSFDLTDCQGRSVLAKGGRTRRGLSSGRTARADTAVVIGAFELGQPAGPGPVCASLRLEDEQGNSTPWLDRRLDRAPGGNAPVFTSAGIGFRGTSAILVNYATADRDDDLVGVFGLARLADGALGPPDGQDDVGAYNAAGYLAPPLPEIPLGNGRPGLADYRSIILFAIDRRGNMSRRELPLF